MSKAGYITEVKDVNGELWDIRDARLGEGETVSLDKDWEENDPTSSEYIKNRTHYVDENGDVQKLDMMYIPTELTDAVDSLNTNKMNKSNPTGTGNLSMSGDIYTNGEKVATEEYVDGAIVQVSVAKDWNQNDSTSGEYIKNRTHYVDNRFELSNRTWNGDWNSDDAPSKLETDNYYIYKVSNTTRNFDDFDYGQTIIKYNYETDKNFEDTAEELGANNYEVKNQVLSQNAIFKKTVEAKKYPQREGCPYWSYDESGVWIRKFLPLQELQGHFICDFVDVIPQGGSAIVSDYTFLKSEVDVYEITEEHILSRELTLITNPEIRTNEQRPYVIADSLENAQASIDSYSGGWVLQEIQAIVPKQSITEKIPCWIGSNEGEYHWTRTMLSQENCPSSVVMVTGIKPLVSSTSSSEYSMSSLEVDFYEAIDNIGTLQLVESISQNSYCYAEIIGNSFDEIQAKVFEDPSRLLIQDTYPHYAICVKAEAPETVLTYSLLQVENNAQITYDSTQINLERGIYAVAPKTATLIDSIPLRAEDEFKQLDQRFIPDNPNYATKSQIQELDEEKQDNLVFEEEYDPETNKVVTKSALAPYGLKSDAAHLKETSLVLEDVHSQNDYFLSEAALGDTVQVAEEGGFAEYTVVEKRANSVTLFRKNVLLDIEIGPITSTYISCSNSYDNDDITKADYLLNFMNTTMVNRIGSTVKDYLVNDAVEKSRGLYIASSNYGGNSTGTYNAKCFLPNCVQVGETDNQTYISETVSNSWVGYFVSGSDTYIFNHFKANGREVKFAAKGYYYHYGPSVKNTSFNIRPAYFFSLDTPVSFSSGVWSMGEVINYKTEQIDRIQVQTDLYKMKDQDARASIEQINTALENKLNKNQGIENIGKALIVDSTGEVIPGDLSSKEDTSNKVVSINAASTDTQYPSAKCVYDLIGDVSTAISSINEIIGGRGGLTGEIPILSVPIRIPTIIENEV